MEVRIKNTRLLLEQGDITQQEVDVIVNAANGNLAHGGGVAAAIAKAAGKELIEASENAEFVETGSFTKTTGGNLKAKYVFHAVGPIWTANDPDVPKLLASAVQSCLKGMDNERLKSIAFPAISTGIYGYPIHSAAQVIITAILGYLEETITSIELIKIILFTQTDLNVFRQFLKNFMSE